MTYIYTLCELKANDAIEVLCWSSDKQELDDEAWRREWKRHNEEKAKGVSGGSASLSPNETESRAFSVKSVRQFDTSMKTLGTDIQNS